MPETLLRVRPPTLLWTEGTIGWAGHLKAVGKARLSLCLLPGLTLSPQLLQPAQCCLLGVGEDHHPNCLTGYTSEPQAPVGSWLGVWSPISKWGIRLHPLVELDAVVAPGIVCRRRWLIKYQLDTSDPCLDLYHASATSARLPSPLAALAHISPCGHTVLFDQNLP